MGLVSLLHHRWSQAEIPPLFPSLTPRNSSPPKMWFPDASESGRDATPSLSSASWRPASPSSGRNPSTVDFWVELALSPVTPAHRRLRARSRRGAQPRIQCEASVGVCCVVCWCNTMFFPFQMPCLWCVLVYGHPQVSWHRKYVGK